MALSAEREGEIARAFYKQHLLDEGFFMDGNMRRRVGNIAKQSGVSYEEAIEFSAKVLSEIVADLSDVTKATENERKGLDERGHPWRDHGGGH